MHYLKTQSGVLLGKCSNYSILLDMYSYYSILLVCHVHGRGSELAQRDG